MLSQETLQQMAEQMTRMKSPQFVDAMKATYNQPSASTPTVGLQPYFLLSLMTTIPVETPLFDLIPRVGNAPGGSSASWKIRNGLNARQITGGTPDRARNQQVGVKLFEYSAAFKFIQMEGSATLGAKLAGGEFVDVEGLAIEDALVSQKIETEYVLLGGNGGNNGTALGAVTGVAVTVNSTSAGSISTANAFARVVALTIDGLRQITAYGVGDDPAVFAADVGAVRTITPDFGNTYTVNLGAGTPSTEATVGSMTGGTNEVKVAWTAVAGAAAYAVYAGATTGGSVKFVGVSYTTSMLVDAFPTTTQAATAITGDRSQNVYVYDGIIPQIARIDTNTGLTAGYVKSLNGATLTSTGKGGVVEIDAFLTDRKKKFKVSKFDIWLGPDMMPNVTAKVTQGSLATPFMIQVESGAMNLQGGQRVTRYAHPITGEVLDVKYHPNLPPGMILFTITPAGLPAEYYKGGNIPAPWRVQEWLSHTSVVWPQNDWARSAAVISAEVLQGFVPFANGYISEIALG